MKLSKVLSLVLAVMMLLGMQTFAFTDVAATANYAEAVQVLSALDIINGYEDGTFKPDGKITRAEYAAIVCRILDMGDAGANKVGGYFTDVPADLWSSGYIATASQIGIVNGMGDGTFAPEAEVTYEQAIAMLVRALGYEKKAQSIGGYPTGYMVIANQESITVGTSNTAGGASRATVARLTYNALTVPMMDQTSWGSDEKFEPIPTQSLLWTKLDAVKADVTINTVPLSKEATDVTLTGGTVDKVAAANAYAVPATAKINGVDLVGMQGLKATVILDKSDDAETKLVTVVSKAGKNVEVTIKPEMLANKNNSGYVEYYKTNDDDRVSKLKLEDTDSVTAGLQLNTYVNLESGTYAANVAVGGNTGDVAYRYVDTDNNGSYDTVFVDNERVFVVGNVNTTSNKIFRDTASTSLTTFTGASLTLDPENDNLAWSIKDTEGNAMGIADIKAGDVVAVKTSNVGSDTYYDITVSNETATGTITETFQETAKVGGTTLNKFKIGDADYMMLDNSAMTPGDSIVAKVYGDKVVSYTVEEGVKNYAIIVDANRAEDFGVTYQLQIFTQKGELVTLDFAEKVNGTTPSYASTAALKAAFIKGDLIAYETNKAGEIKAIDTQTADTDFVLDTTDRFAATSSEFKPASEKLGSYYITANTVVFTTSEARTAITKDDVAIATADILEADTPYNYSVIANSDKEAMVVVLFEAEGNIKMDSYPIAITKTATVTVEGESRTKLFGLVNGEAAEIIVAEDAEASVTGLTVGDIAMFTTNAAGEMVKAYTLADKNGDNFIVKANYADDDEDGDVAGNLVTLSTTNRTAAGCMTVGATHTLKGFGAAGKAYKVQGNLLRLVKAADYAATFSGTDRDYTNITDEDMIQDYSVNASAVAYLYDTATNKYTVTTLLDAETDYTTADYQHGDQIDNDDLVYVYNYDGETKLVLIVDVASDN